MGLADGIGSLAAGKWGDFVILDPRPCLPLNEWPDDLDVASLIWAIVLRFRPAAIKAVYVAGRPVWSPAK